MSPVGTFRTWLDVRAESSNAQQSGRPLTALNLWVHALDVRAVEDHRDLIFALILHSRKNLYASCGDYTQREKLDET